LRLGSLGRNTNPTQQFLKSRIVPQRSHPGIHPEPCDSSRALADRQLQRFERQLQDNLNPVGRVSYSFSTLLCTPRSRSQEVGLCLDAQADEKRNREVVTAGGFTRFRCASETPFNIVYEPRP